MKQGASIFSFALNVILLLAMIFLHFYDVSSCKKEEPKADISSKENRVICTSEMTVEGNTVPIVFRVVIDYETDGTITSLKTGEVTHYTDKESYDNALSRDGLNEDLGNQNVFHYNESDGKITGEDGSVHHLWYKNLVENYQKSGYTCK